MLGRVGLIVLSLWLGFFILAGIVIHYTGLLVVDVQNKIDGDRIYLPVPMLMLNFALSFLPDHRFEMFRSELQERRELLRAVSNQLVDCPDTTFLHADTHRGTVSVIKRGRNLLIDADTPRDKVHIQVPIQELGRQTPPTRLRSGY